MRRTEQRDGRHAQRRGDVTRAGVVGDQQVQAADDALEHFEVDVGRRQRDGTALHPADDGAGQLVLARSGHDDDLRVQVLY